MKEKIKNFWKFLTSKESIYAILAMMFAGALVTANVVAFRQFTLGWKWFGELTTFNVGTFCYAITLLISNTVAYLYGPTKAKHLIAGGFAAQILSTLLIVVLGFTPAANSSFLATGEVVSTEVTYAAVLGQNWAMVIGSLAGYLFCQGANYLVFNRLLKKLDNAAAKGVWNFVANIIGQLFDTVVFDVVAFGIFGAFGYPQLWNGGLVPLTGMILFTWFFKIIVAAVYTGVFYLLTVKRNKAASEVSEEAVAE